MSGGGDVARAPDLIRSYHVKEAEMDTSLQKEQVHVLTRPVHATRSSAAGARAARCGLQDGAAADGAAGRQHRGRGAAPQPAAAGRQAGRQDRWEGRGGEGSTAAQRSHSVCVCVAGRALLQARFCGTCVAAWTPRRCAPAARPGPSPWRTASRWGRGGRRGGEVGGRCESEGRALGHSFWVAAWVRWGIQTMQGKT